MPVKPIVYAIAALSLTTGGVLSAAQPGRAAQAEVPEKTRSEQNTRSDKGDQGDENAALRAIVEVCLKDTPAAKRSAICFDENPDGPVSPG